MDIHKKIWKDSLLGPKIVNFLKLKILKLLVANIDQIKSNILDDDVFLLEFFNAIKVSLLKKIEI